MCLQITLTCVCAGYCGCTLQDFKVETCNDVGETVVSDPTGICSVYLNSPVVSTLSSFRTYVGWKDLAITSCALLDTTKTICYRVDTSGGTQRISAGTAVVGFRFISSRRLVRRRRSLLAVDTGNLELDGEGSMYTDEEASAASSEMSMVQYLLWNASWIHSGQPCTSLVHAYRVSSHPTNQGSHSFSVMDRHVLKHCLHWRMAANHTLAIYAPGTLMLDGMGDVFMLSYNGLSAALTDDRFMNGMIDAFPHSIIYLASYAEWAEPFISSVKMIESYIKHFEIMFINRTIDYYASHMNQSKNGSAQLFSNNTLHSRQMVLDRLQASKQMMHHLLPFMHAGMQFASHTLESGRNVSREIDTAVSTFILDFPPIPEYQLSALVAINASSRHLLQWQDSINSTNNTQEGESTWKERLQSIPVTQEIGMVQAYSSLIAAGAYKSALLPAQLANRWKEGPFVWPVSIYATDMHSSCPVGADAAGVIISAFESLREQLLIVTGNAAGSTAPSGNHSTVRVLYSFPRIHKHIFRDKSESLSTYRIKLPLGPLSSSKLEFDFSFDSSNDPVHYLVGFFIGNYSEEDRGYTLSRMLKEYFVCSFDEVVMKCRNKTTSLVPGTIAILIMLCLYSLAFGFSAPVFLSAISITGIILWHVYGYSPACFPLVPPCILQDVVDVFKWFIPLQLEWPAALQHVDGCAYNESVPLDKCFRSCRDDPFYYGEYQGWEASVAWLLCDWDPDWCKNSVLPWAVSNTGTWIPSTFAQMIEQKSNTLFFQNYPAHKQFIEAQRFCFYVHLIYFVPYLFIIIICIYAVILLLSIPFVLIQSLADFLFQTLVFTHMHAAITSDGRQPV